jgi:hypothetical protein
VFIAVLKASALEELTDSKSVAINLKKAIRLVNLRDFESLSGTMDT